MLTYVWWFFIDFLDISFFLSMNIYVWSKLYCWCFRRSFWSSIEGVPHLLQPKVSKWSPIQTKLAALLGLRAAACWHAAFSKTVFSEKSTLFGKEIAQSTMLCKKVMNELTELVDNALSSIVVYTWIIDGEPFFE